MKDIRKILFSIVIMMILSIFTIAISAEETNVVESSGTVFNYTTYTVDGTTMAAITGYVSGNSDFIIPEKIGDYVVCKISSKAFNDNNVITSVVIPNCVTTIEELAFRNCDMLMSVVIPDSVTTIGDCAFENCDQLTDVVIGNSVNYWGSWCFANNPKLTNLTFNEGLVHIGKRSESSAISDSYATYEKYYYYDSNGNLDQYSDRNCTYLSRPSIYGSPFANCTSLTTVSIPDSVTTIWQGAFAGCSKLNTVNFGEGLQTLGNYAFYNCVVLVNAELNDGLVTIGKGSFQNDAKLKSVDIPSTVTQIHSYAYKDCVLISSVNSAKANIGDYAFAGCTRLETVEMRSGATAIGNYAFYGCTNLNNITFSRTIKTIGDYCFYNCDSLTVLTIPNAVTSIGKCAFAESKMISDVTIGNSVQTIGDYAFNNCENLVDLIIGNSVIEIGILAFRNCDKLISVIIPDSVTTIGDCAFESCDQITDVVIGNSVNYWGSWCFANNPKLTNLTFNEGLVHIGKRSESSAISDSYATYEKYYYYDSNGNLNQYSDRNCTYLSRPSIYGSPFANCTSLTTVSIPDSVTTIWQGAFAGCTSLAEIALGTDAMTIGNYAFYNCELLSKITILEYVDTIGKGAFDNSTLATIYGITGTYAETYATEKGIEFVDINNTEKYYIVFLDSDGSEIDSTTIISGNSMILPAPKKSDYSFIGWAITADGEAEYAPGAEFTPDSDTTLYAVWESASVSVTEVNLNKSSMELTVGEAEKLIATVIPTEASNKIVKWTSSNSDIASVDQTGKVTAISEGTAVITVTSSDGGKSASCNVTVKAKNTDEEFDENSPQIIIGKVEAMAGETIEVPISIANNPGIAGIGFEVGFNDSAMSLVGIEYGIWVGTDNSDQNPAPGTIAFSFSNASNITADNVIVTLIFKVDEETATGTYNIEILESNVSDQDISLVQMAHNNGSVSVIDYIVGDITGDSEIDSRDAVLLAQFLAKWKVTLNESAADCNADGAVDSKDAVLLAQYLAKWKVTLG